MGTIVFFLIGSSAAVLSYLLYEIHSINSEIKELTELERRNENVYNYKMKVLHEDMEAYKKLASYDEMLYSDKPLTDEYWLNK